MDTIVQRYLNMENSGTEIYFDADEIVELLDHFELSDDWEHYNKVLKLGQKIHPHNIDIKIRACKVHIYKEDFEKALTQIEQIGDPENQELRWLKYECLCALDRYNEVITLLEAQLSYPDEEDLQDTFEFLAALLNEYKSNNAYDLIARGLALFPDNCLLKEELCFYFETQGDLTQALEVSKQLVDANPYSADYWYIRGRLYALMEEYDQAIESLDFALISDDSDLEIKIMKAYCHFMNENNEKVFEIYVELFDEETDPVIVCLRPFMEKTECAYLLLKTMLEAFDENQVSDLGLRDLPFFPLKNDKKENGFSIISPCFPSSLLFFLLMELLFLTDGAQQTIRNIEQLLHVLYQTGMYNKNFQLDPECPSCVSLKQEITNIMDKKTPDSDCNENDFYAVRQLIIHLLDGNISLFCRQYEQCTSEVIAEYLGKIFFASRKSQRHQATYLFSNEINKNDLGYIPSNKLSANYLNDKKHHN